MENVNKKEGLESNEIFKKWKLGLTKHEPLRKGQCGVQVSGIRIYLLRWQVHQQEQGEGEWFHCSGVADVKTWISRNARWECAVCHHVRNPITSFSEVENVPACGPVIPLLYVVLKYCRYLYNVDVTLWT